MNYSMSPNAIFDTFQGEGLLSGIPMTFIRLAGCNIGCKECDTDYSVSSRMAIEDIMAVVESLPKRKWAWITGGEPTVHDIRPLTSAIRKSGRHVAMATAGEFKFGDGWSSWYQWADHIYVSPHKPSGPIQFFGNEINIVPGLNGLEVEDILKWDLGGYPTKWVTPKHGCQQSKNDAMRLVRMNNGWRLGCQSHKVWGVA